MQAGWFFEGHRAGNDVAALTALMGIEVFGERTILSHLLKCSETPTVRIEAVGVPFAAKDLLKGAGYRWDVASRYWSREVDEAGLATEIGWLEEHIYRGRGQANLRRITAHERFSRNT